jgi:hypothetical protein
MSINSSPLLASGGIFALPPLHFSQPPASFFPVFFSLAQQSSRTAAARQRRGSGSMAERPSRCSSQPPLPVLLIPHSNAQGAFPLPRGVRQQGTFLPCAQKLLHGSGEARAAKLPWAPPPAVPLADALCGSHGTSLPLCSCAGSPSSAGDLGSPMAASSTPLAAISPLLLLQDAQSCPMALGSLSQDAPWSPPLLPHGSRSPSLPSHRPWLPSPAMAPRFFQSSPMADTHCSSFPVSPWQQQETAPWVTPLPTSPPVFPPLDPFHG